jgi:hypothetical protein
MICMAYKIFQEAITTDNLDIVGVLDAQDDENAEGMSNIDRKAGYSTYNPHCGTTKAITN